MASISTSPSFSGSHAVSTSSNLDQTLADEKAKYVDDQRKLAAGQLDPAQLTADWDAYISTATSQQAGGAGGNPAPNEILPNNEPSASASFPTFGDSPVKAANSATVSGSTASGAAPVGAASPVTTNIPTNNGSVPSYLQGSATLDPSFRKSIYAPYADAIEAVAKATGVSANILGAIAAQESRGSGSNANPLQVSFNVSNNTAANILEGAKELIGDANIGNQMFGNGSLGLALRVYNSGQNGTDPNNLNTTKGTGDPTYVSRVTSNLQTISSGNGQNLPG